MSTPNRAHQMNPHLPLNQSLSLSENGRNALVRREGLIRHYYNDPANNCTYGVGTLAHSGLCTPQEMRTRISNDQLATSLQHGISLAESAVRRRVTRQRLTQQQFDALVSFTYNVGAGAAHHVLHQINGGQIAGAVHTMTAYTHATVYGPDRQPLRDKNGRIVTRVLPGLVMRRHEESAPFRLQHGVNRGGQQ
jgi:lysozyme